MSGFELTDAQRAAINEAMKELASPERPKENKFDQLTWDVLDDDLKEMAATQLYLTTALLAIQQTRHLRAIAWCIEDIRTDWPGAR